MSNRNMHVNHCMLFLAVLQYTLNASNRSLEVICPLQVTVNSCEPLGHPNKWGTTNLVPAAYLLHFGGAATNSKDDMCHSMLPYKEAAATRIKLQGL